MISREIKDKCSKHCLIFSFEKMKSKNFIIFSSYLNDTFCHLIEATSNFVKNAHRLLNKHATNGKSFFSVHYIRTPTNIVKPKCFNYSHYRQIESTFSILFQLQRRCTDCKYMQIVCVGRGDDQINRQQKSDQMAC